MPGGAIRYIVIEEHRETTDTVNVRGRVLQYALLGIVVLVGAYPLRLMHWQGNQELHTLLEAISSVLALSAGVMALVRYYARKNSTFLLLGSCFLGAGFLDAYHGWITSSFMAGKTPSALAALTPWSGGVARFYMSLLLFGSVVAWYRDARRPGSGKINEFAVYGLVGAWALANFLFFSLVSVSPAYFPDWWIHRPTQLVPGIFFALATAGYLRKGQWRTDAFEHWLVLSLIAATASDLAYMTSYTKLYDALYITGHLLKIATYLMLLIGLLSNTFAIFKREAENATQLEERVRERTLELSRANGELAEEVAERKEIQSKLEQATRAAEMASRAKGEFLANMSHEIRTPMNGVIGMTNLALETELSAEQHEYLSTIKLSADTLLVLINDILDFSKIEAGKIELEERDFDLRESLYATLRTLALRSHEKGLELLCDVMPEVPQFVRGDATRLRQIVLNLVGNAIKFTTRGEVSVQVAAGGTPNEWHVTVSDTGIGIPPHKLAAIFEPFSQADASTTRNYGGTGLGLTISTRLVQMMGGKIWVESEVGHGTKFHFTVRMAAVQAAMPDPLSADLRALKVLAVDDNETNRRILASILHSWGLHATMAADAAEALRRLDDAKSAAAPFAVVLSDMHMPTMDGFQLVEEMRARPQWSATPVILLTSSSARGDLGRCQRLGVAARLLKPVSPSELFDALATVVGAKREAEKPDVASARDADAKSEPAKRADGLRVLVAEDNAVNQLLVKRMLEKRGHHVTAAANGRDALELLAQETFDLVLMDLQMPEMDGLEATEALRKTKRDQAHRQAVVALTANAMKGDSERCMAAGMDGYLTKPIRAEELDAVLLTYLQRKRELQGYVGVLPG